MHKKITLKPPMHRCRKTGRKKIAKACRKTHKICTKTEHTNCKQKCLKNHISTKENWELTGRSSSNNHCSLVCLFFNLGFAY